MRVGECSVLISAVAHGDRDVILPASQLWLACCAGTIDLVVPGQTACLACSAHAAPSNSTMGEHAALPSTDAILAGLLVQTALKHLLGFQEAPAQGSLSVTDDELASRSAKPHEACVELHCRKLQQKFGRNPSRCGASSLMCCRGVLYQGKRAPRKNGRSRQRFRSVGVRMRELMLSELCALVSEDAQVSRWPVQVRIARIGHAAGRVAAARWLPAGRFGRVKVNVQASTSLTLSVTTL